MPEALILEEQKEMDRQAYCDSIVMLFGNGISLTFSSLYIFFLNLLSVLSWKKESSVVDLIVACASIIPALMALPFGYGSVYAFAKGIPWLGLWFAVLIALGSSVYLKVMNAADVPPTLLIVSYIHDLILVTFIYAMVSHKTAFAASVEFGWDEFDCLDYIVKPGIEAAFTKMNMAGIAKEDDDDNDVVVDKQQIQQVQLGSKPHMPVVAVKVFTPNDFARDFQKSLRLHANQKRELCEWMQSVK